MNPFNANNNNNNNSPQGAGVSASGAFLGEQIKQHLILPEAFRIYYTVNSNKPLAPAQTSVLYMELPANKAKEWNHLLGASAENMKKCLLENFFDNMDLFPQECITEQTKQYYTVVDYEWHCIYAPEALRAFVNNVKLYNDSMQE